MNTRRSNAPIVAVLFSVCVLAVGLLASNDAQAQDLGLGAETSLRDEGDLGVGIGSGTLANGLSVRYVFDEGNAIQGFVGVTGGTGIDDRFDDNDALGLGADYLVLFDPFFTGRVFTLSPNLGAGAGVAVGDNSDDLNVAASLVAGLELGFVQVPIDLTAEYRPTLALRDDAGNEDADLDLVDFTASLRYHF